MRFQVAGRGAILTASNLSEYMSSANIRFSDVADDDSVLDANLAHFASHTFAHVRLPPASVEWPRDSASRERLVVIVAEDAGFTVQSDAPIIGREPGLTVVPPGTAPVYFRAAAPTELLFVSCMADSLPGIDLLLQEPDSNAASVEPSQLHALTGFVKSLCSITAGVDEEDAAPLTTVGREVTRSLVSMAVGNRPAKPDLFTLAMQLIVREFARDDISVRWAAEQLHASLRTTQDAFAKRNTTFSRELRAVRLKAVDELRKRGGAPSLADAALAAGFGSSAAYYRAAKEAADKR